MIARLARPTLRPRGHRGARGSSLPLSTLIALAGLSPIGCSDATPEVSTVNAALTAEQCEFFQVDGKVQICHKTSSTKNPYTILKVASEACIDGHAAHTGDYVAYNDPTCKGLGCFPVGAPVDGTVECCDGLIEKDGHCACPDDTQCTTWSPNADGTCSATQLGAETSCSDDVATTANDHCDGGGACASSACQGATCTGDDRICVSATAGEVLALDGVSLTVPSGSPELTICRTTDVPPTTSVVGATIDARSSVYEFLPSGALSHPVTIAWQVGSSSDLTVFWAEDGESYDEPGDVSVAGGVMSFTATHFSKAVASANSCPLASDLGKVCGAMPTGPSAGPCSAEPICQQNGSKLKCKAAFQPTGTECRAASDLCDAAETCDGTTKNCPADLIATAGIECRAAGGACDVAEACDGLSTACPTDAKLTSECRPAAGACDVAESCDGLSTACPADAKLTSECRPAAGICDVAESCDGVADECPADAKLTSECRPAAGICDVAESCDGVGDACPTDAFDLGAECDAAGNACEVAAVCGAAATCPAVTYKPANTSCNDGDSGTINDVCNGAGACAGVAAPPADACGRATPRTPVCSEEFVGDSGTFVDARDGKEYSWLKIGRQYWMGENLDFGAHISSGARQTNNCAVEKHCHNDDSGRCDVLGGLYEYGELMQYVETAQTQGICPAGWYVPSDTDWNALTSYIGGENNSAWLKSTRTSMLNTKWVPDVLRNPLYPTANLYLDTVAAIGYPMWQWPNTGARDKIGFNMLPSDWTNATVTGDPASLADGSNYGANYWSSSGSSRYRHYSAPLIRVSVVSLDRAYTTFVRCVSACSDSTMPSGPFIGTSGSFTDTRDNRSYRWVRIDEEIYMRDNLLYGQSDGTYTWDEAMAGSSTEGAQGACPVGWHVPTASEWHQTVAYVGPTWWGSGTNASARLRGQNESVDFNANNNIWLSTGTSGNPSSSKIGAILLSAFAEAWDKPRTDAYAVRCAKDSVPGVHEPMPW